MSDADIAAFAEKNKKQQITEETCCFGTPDAIRTHDLQSRSLTLYPTELRAHIQLTYYIGYFRVLQGETEKTKKYSKFRKKDVDISPAR